ncbi:MAG: hypothetical protein ACMG6S_09515 [Byssovorax sp.]
MQAQIVDPLPLVDLPSGQGASLAVDRSGRLHVSDGPFEGGEQLAASDAAAVTAPHRALWIGVAGTLAGEMKKKDGTTATFATSVPSGVFPFEVTKINSTGTTATGIIAGW